ncbi:Solute carrier family 22 member 20 [Varanus komodoensis]|nr:Solute carrier family 22 member 20 [Varanus komodoensis]
MTAGRIKPLLPACLFSVALVLPGNVQFCYPTQYTWIKIVKEGTTSLDLHVATLCSRLAEIRAKLDKEEHDNLELQREESLLIDLASNLQKQLTGKESNLLQVSSKMLQLDEAISALKMRHTLRQSLQSEKMG